MYPNYSDATPYHNYPKSWTSQFRFPYKKLRFVAPNPTFFSQARSSNTWKIRSYQDITKTCLYNVDPLKPHFYTVKLGFTGVYIIFLIFAQNIDCGYSLEPPRRGGSNEYPQSTLWAEMWKISEFFIWKFFSFLEVKFPIHLNRRVFVMKCSMKADYQIALKVSVLTIQYLGRLFTIEPEYAYSKISLRSLYMWLSLTNRGLIARLLFFPILNLLIMKALWRLQHIFL